MILYLSSRGFHVVLKPMMQVIITQCHQIHHTLRQLIILEILISKGLINPLIPLPFLKSIHNIIFNSSSAHLHPQQIYCNLKTIIRTILKMLRISYRTNSIKRQLSHRKTIFTIRARCYNNNNNSKTILNFKI